MNKMVDALFNISHLEELARRDAWLNRIDPFVKMLVTFLYILCIASVGKYDLAVVLLYGVYPVLIFLTGDLPGATILPKLIVPVLASGSLGILNPYFDKQYIVLSQSMHVSAGWLSLLTLFIKSMLTILGALILVSTTKVEDIAASLERMKLPTLVTVQFLIMFRYITLLVEEVERTITAYSLRSAGKRAVTHGVWGSMVGQLFIRTSERSLKVYESMKLRGFNGHFQSQRTSKRTGRDWLFAGFWMTLFVGFRFYTWL